MDQTKPYKGRLRNWFPVLVTCEQSLGIVIIGEHMDHLIKPNQTIHTSLVVAHEGNEIETRNSRYTLINEQDRVH